MGDFGQGQGGRCGMCPDDAETRFSLLGRPRGGLLGPLHGVGRNMGVRIGLSTFPHGFGHYVMEDDALQKRPPGVL